MALPGWVAVSLARIGCHASDAYTTTPLWVRVPPSPRPASRPQSPVTPAPPVPPPAVRRTG